MNELKTIGGNLRRLRLSSGLTQADLSQKVGLTKDTISKIELGKQKNIGIKHLISICQVLDVGLERLFIKGANLIPINLVVSDGSVHAIGRIVEQFQRILAK